MDSTPELTLAFISKHPDSAARVLASLPAEDAAGFIESIPTRYSVQLLVWLQTNIAASVVKILDLTVANAIIRDMEFASAVAVLRQLSAENQKAILADLPARQRRGYETSLAFSPDTVGARMSTAVDALTPTDRVADALSLKRTKAGSASDLVFVVDEQRVLIGVVKLLPLLQRPDTTQLSELVETACETVSPRTRLTELRKLNAWHSFSGVPVVSRRGELLGVISRHLADGAKIVGSPAGEPGSSSMTGETIHMMADGMAALAGLLNRH